MRAVTKEKSFVAIEPLHKLHQKHRCFMSEHIAQRHSNVSFFIQLFSFSEDTFEPSRCNDIQVFDTALKDSKLFSVEAKRIPAGFLRKEYGHVAPSRTKP